jgi:hypothetical protein
MKVTGRQQLPWDLRRPEDEVHTVKTRCRGSVVDTVARPVYPKLSSMEEPLKYFFSYPVQPLGMKMFTGQKTKGQLFVHGDDGIIASWTNIFTISRKLFEYFFALFQNFYVFHDSLGNRGLGTLDWAVGWAVWCSNPSRGKRFFSSRKRPDTLWGRPSILFNGYLGFSLW